MTTVSLDYYKTFTPVDNRVSETMTISLFLLICSVCFVRSEISKRNAVKKISTFQIFSSFFECQIESAFFNTAQSLHIPLPNIPARPITERDVSFFIYSREHLVPYEVNTYDKAQSINTVLINRERRTVLIVPGLRDTYKQYASIVTKALFPKEDIILIAVDWDSYAFYNKIYTRNNTIPKLGDILAKFLRQYIDSGANRKDIYLIGGSSGAQAIGIAAKQIQPRVGRILGIDPVGTCYNFLPPDMRLTSDDADFVEIVHCSTGTEGEPLSFMGHVTFYMNCGVIQPKCAKKATVDEITICSHLICDEYVVETLYNFNRYIGVKCGSYAKYKKRQCNCRDTEPMGYNTPISARGSYFVQTEQNSSLCP